MLVKKAELEQTMKEVLMRYGVDAETAEACTENLVENTLYGVASHGVNRFLRLTQMIKEGKVVPDAKPTLVFAQGAMECWDGNLGLGNLNAKHCMDRAVTLAKEYGIGCVALRHTNHWMRGGAYGIQAAKQGCASILWTNTMPNMPAWGARDRRIGNNPLIMCVPYQDSFVMVDAAMAQFSYGAIEKARLNGTPLNVPGGYDEAGNLTTDAVSIEKTWRVLPIGYWKGSGFSVLMDLMGAMLSQGMSVHEIGKQGDQPTDEYNLSQIFIAFKIQDSAEADRIAEQIIGDLKKSEPASPDTAICYPGENSQRKYHQNLDRDIEVNDTIWTQIKGLSGQN